VEKEMAHSSGREVNDQRAAWQGGHRRNAPWAKVPGSRLLRMSNESPLGELIHQYVRGAIEMAVHEEVRAALGVQPYERHEARRRYRNGTKSRTLSGSSGPLALTVPRATLFNGREWTSTLLPRYQRRLPEVNEAIAATYLAGGNTRRIRGALQPLLKAAPLSKSAVSRVVATLKDGLEAWRTRSLTDIDAIYLYLDGLASRAERRQGRKRAGARCGRRPGRRP
jgi:transposase-like protein